MWPDPENTLELLDGVRQGQSGALDRLLGKYREALRRMVDMRMDRRLRGRVDASDIVQDVLIDANRRLPDYLKDPAMPFHLWLRQMAQDRVIDAYRRHCQAARRSVDREQNLAAPGWSDHSTMELAAQLQDRNPTPAAEAVFNELQARFQQAVEQLAPSDREIVMMRHFEKLSNSETAQALGLEPPAASMRYLRAMRQLRAVFDEPSSSEG